MCNSIRVMCIDGMWYAASQFDQTLMGQCELDGSAGFDSFSGLAAYLSTFGYSLKLDLVAA